MAEPMTAEEQAEWQRILKVERPKNTIVEDNHSNGPNRYMVRERNGNTKGSGGKSYPVNGGVIGHIVNHVYVPCIDNSLAAPNLKPFLQFGNAIFFRDIMQDVYEDLLKCFPVEDVMKIMVLAAFHLFKASCTDRGVQKFYNESFLKVYYPGAALSKNTRTALYENLGENITGRLKFNQMRVDEIEQEHHIVIDSTLRQDTSVVNSLSELSRKSRVRGCKDISVMYAFDTETMEPICGLVYPGNVIDATAYRDFLVQNNIRKGMIITDKGFPFNKVRNYVNGFCDLSFMSPLKTNDTRIATNKMTEYDGVLKNYPISYKKVKLSSGNYLYSFDDPYIKGDAIAKYMEKAKQKRAYSYEDYARKTKTGGLIIFESDRDLDPEQVYIIYQERWLLEMCFRQYKNDLEFDDTKVHTDYAVIGDEFIKFISTIAACRMTRRGVETGILEEMTFGDMIDDLATAWRQVDAPAPAIGDGFWSHPMIIEQNVVLAELGIAVPDADTQKEMKKIEKKAESKPKEKTRKFKKNPAAATSSDAEQPADNTQSAADAPKEKKHVGRPRKPVSEPKKKNPVGRPRKPRKNTPKRGVGRPRKNNKTN